MFDPKKSGVGSPRTWSQEVGFRATYYATLENRRCCANEFTLGGYVRARSFSRDFVPSSWVFSDGQIISAFNHTKERPHNMPPEGYRTWALQTGHLLCLLDNSGFQKCVNLETLHLHSAGQFLKGCHRRDLIWPWQGPAAQQWQKKKTRTGGGDILQTREGAPRSALNPSSSPTMASRCSLCPWFHIPELQLLHSLAWDNNGTCFTKLFRGEVGGKVIWSI